MSTQYFSTLPTSQTQVESLQYSNENGSAQASLHTNHTILGAKSEPDIGTNDSTNHPNLNLNLGINQQPHPHPHLPSNTNPHPNITPNTNPNVNPSPYNSALTIHPQTPQHEQYQTTFILRRFEQTLDQRLNVLYTMSDALLKNQAILNTDHRSLASQLTQYVQGMQSTQDRDHEAFKREQEAIRKEREAFKAALTRDHERERERQREKQSEMEEVVRLLNERVHKLETIFEGLGKRIDLLALGLGQIDKKFGTVQTTLQESDFTLKEIYETIKDPKAFGTSSFVKRTPMLPTLPIISR